MANGDRALAVFIDFENLALGFQGRRDRFEISRVLERLVEKGKIVCKKAYADWSRFGFYTAPLHECAIELIEIPRRAQSGKNSADIRLCVDAMDLAYSKDHIDTFVVVSGDSDFSPLVSKLKELGKHVIGLGMQQSTSDLLRDNCDEFIYYEDLDQVPEMVAEIDSRLPEAKRKAFALLIDALLALRRESKEQLWSSMVKDTMKRKKPSFNEAYHGYRSFSELLEDAAREGLLELDTDKRSRTYVVTRFGAEMTAPRAEAPPPTATAETPSEVTPSVNGSEPTPAPLPPAPRKRSRRRRSAKRRANSEVAETAASVPPEQPATVVDPTPEPPPVAAAGAEEAPAKPARAEAKPRERGRRSPRAAEAPLPLFAEEPPDPSEDDVSEDIPF